MGKTGKIDRASCLETTETCQISMFASIPTFLGRNCGEPLETSLGINCRNRGAPMHESMHEN